MQLQGITIRKKTPDILEVISFTSPDRRYDNIYLSNFATINVRDELLRIDGVSDINVFGERDYSMRAWLDPQKMAARNITSGDVAAAIKAQNVEAAPGRIGQPPAARGLAFELSLGHPRPADHDRAVRADHHQDRGAAPAPDVHADERLLRPGHGYDGRDRYDQPDAGAQRVDRQHPARGYVRVHNRRHRFDDEFEPLDPRHDLHQFGDVRAAGLRVGAGRQRAGDRQCERRDHDRWADHLQRDRGRAGERR